MFQKILNWIRKAVNRLIPKQNIAGALGVEAQVSDKMAAAVDLWMRLYAGKPPWLYHARGERDSSMQTLKLPAIIAAKVAKLATLEAKIELTGGGRAAYLQDQLAPVLREIRRHVEYACAAGGLVFKPYISGGDIAVDITHANAFYPTAFNGRGEVIGAVFAEQVFRGNRYYTRLEHHNLAGDGYHITNEAYVSRDRDALGTEVPLASVAEWADMEPEATVQGIDRPLFAYFRIPFANEIDPESPLGVSVYSRAVDAIREADKLYSGILWEYEGSQLAVDADITALMPGPDGKPRELPQRDKRLFRNTGLSGGSAGDFYKVFSPEIRDASLYNGLNRQLHQVEMCCGLSFGTLSDPQNVDKTATEIKSSKQDMYTTISDVQKALSGALEQLLYAIDVWATLGRLAPPGGYSATIDFGDSVLGDPEAEKQRDLQEVREGIMSKVEYRMKWYSEDEKTARKKLALVDAGPSDTDLMGFDAL